jgi:hypothetical protein
MNTTHSVIRRGLVQCHHGHVFERQVAVAGISLIHYLIITSHIPTASHVLSRLRQFTKQALLLVSGMASLDAKIVSKLAAGLEGAIGVAL